MQLSPNIKSLEKDIRSIRTCTPCGKGQSENDNFKLLEMQSLHTGGSALQRLRQQRQKVESLKKQFQAAEKQLKQKNGVLRQTRKQVDKLSQTKAAFDDLSLKCEKLGYELARQKQMKADADQKVAKIQKDNLKEENRNLKNLISAVDSSAKQTTQQITINFQALKQSIAASQKMSEQLQLASSQLNQLRQISESENQLLQTKLKELQLQTVQLREAGNKKDSQIAQLIKEQGSIKQAKTETEERRAALEEMESAARQNLQQLKNQARRQKCKQEQEMKEVRHREAKLIDQLESVTGKVNSLQHMRDNEMLRVSTILEKIDQAELSANRKALTARSSSSRLAEVQAEAARLKEVAERLGEELNCRVEAEQQELKVGQQLCLMRLKLKQHCQSENQRMEELIGQFNKSYLRIMGK